MVADVKQGGVRMSQGKIALIVVGVMILLGVVAATITQASELEKYRAEASEEIANREAILNQYDARSKDMDRIIALEGQIHDNAATINGTDCASTTDGYCNDYEIYNTTYEAYEKAFDEKDTLWAKAQASISSQNEIANPPQVWLLKFFGLDDSGKLSADLAQYSADIENRKTAINDKIDQILKLEADCNYPPALTCTDLTDLLEKE